MKDKILLFIIGFLAGAVVATGIFYIYTIKTDNNCTNNNTQMNGGQPPEMPGGQNSENGEPPAKPEGDNGGQPPEKPSN